MSIAVVALWSVVAVFAFASVFWAARRRGDALRRARADVIRAQLRREDAQLRRLAADVEV